MRLKQDSLKISICSLAFNLKVLMLESLWAGLICEGRGRGKGSGEERMEAPGSRPGEMWPSEEEAGERGAEVSCWLLDVPGGCPGELDEEEEGNAEEGKQGMEEVTCSMEAGRPGRPMEEETLGAVK